MAAIENKRFIPPSQPNKNPATSTRHSTPKHRNPKKKTHNKPRKCKPLPASLRSTVTKLGKTTIRRFAGRTLYRLDEFKGKTVDFVQLFLIADCHSIQVHFDDKTSLRFAVDPGFTLEMEHADWKTGNWRSIKKWPLIRSQSYTA